MRNLTYIVAGFSIALIVPMSFTRAGDKLEAGFTSLFDGKTFDGWREKGSKDKLDGKTEAHKGRFKIEGGTIHYVYTDKIKGDKYIETTKEFAKDVHFKFDFKAGKGCNNDILFRGTKYDIVPGKGENKEVKEGEWYTFELVATGDKVEHRINGKVVRAAKDAKAKAGTIVLRAEFGEIEIKNIRVKD